MALAVSMIVCLAIPAALASGEIVTKLCARPVRDPTAVAVLRRFVSHCRYRVGRPFL